MKRLALASFLLVFGTPAPALADPDVCASVVNVVLRSAGLADSLGAPRPGITTRSLIGRWARVPMHELRDPKRGIDAMIFERDERGHSIISVRQGAKIVRFRRSDGVEDATFSSDWGFFLHLDRRCRIEKILSPDPRNTVSTDEAKDLRLPAFFCRELLSGAPLVRKGETLVLERIRDGRVAVGREEEARRLCAEYAALLSPDPEPPPEPARPAPVVAPKTSAGDQDDPVDPALDASVEELLRQLEESER